MQVVIVFESYYGNSRRVAEAIAAGMLAERPDTDVTCVPVLQADPAVVRADLLVVGGPTHMHGMSSVISRRIALRTDAAKEAGEVPQRAGVGPGLRELVKALPRVAWGTRAAAFDTRGESKSAGGAAQGIARRLRARGYTLVAPPTGFLVTGADGPLAEGELDRAEAWGASLLGRENLSVATS